MRSGVSFKMSVAAAAAAALGALVTSAQAETFIQISIVGAGSVSSETGSVCGNGKTACKLTTKGLGGVTLTASPNAGSTFASWSGKCSPQGATCFVPVYDDGSTIKIVAKFASKDRAPAGQQLKTKNCPPYCPKIQPIIPCILDENAQPSE